MLQIDESEAPRPSTVLPTVPSEEGRSKSRKLGKRWNSARPMGDLIISAIVPPEEFSVILLIGGPGAGDGNAKEWKNLDALDGVDENSSQ